MGANSTQSRRVRRVCVPSGVRPEKPLSKHLARGKTHFLAKAAKPAATAAPRSQQGPGMLLASPQQGCTSVRSRYRHCPHCPISSFPQAPASGLRSRTPVGRSRSFFVSSFTPNSTCGNTDLPRQLRRVCARSRAVDPGGAPAMPTAGVGGESRRRFPCAGTAWERHPGTWRGADRGCFGADSGCDPRGASPGCWFWDGGADSEL